MPRIFESFGYPVGDNSPEAKQCRKDATCPFMQTECDGGGNRYLSHIDLRSHPQLKDLFPRRTQIPSSVCSIEIQDGSPPWIVCPRRLMVLGKSGAPGYKYQSFAKSLLLSHLPYPVGTRLGVWPEVKLKYTEFSDREAGKSFDYTFDYILVPVRRMPLADKKIAKLATRKQLRDTLESAGYTLLMSNGRLYVDDFPVGPPSIVEIMTSSTSGGNKRNRTTIPMAFEDAMLGRDHRAPGINYRQVWARMVSQLIVKSEVALAWGGKAVWVLQDVLVDYISKTTALDLRNFLAEKTAEVNVLSFSYGKLDGRTKGVLELREGKLLSGPIGPAAQERSPAFLDMVRAPLKPSVDRIHSRLARKAPTAILFMS